MHANFGGTIRLGPVKPVRMLRYAAVRPRAVNGLSGALIDVLDGSEAARAADLQARIEALNARRVAMGRMTQEAADAANAAVAADDPDTYVSQVGDAFIEGAKEGETAELEWVGTVSEKIVSVPVKLAVQAANSAARGFFGNLPWWVWVGGVIAILWWTGAIGPGLFAATRGSARGVQAAGIRRLRRLSGAKS